MCECVRGCEKVCRGSPFFPAGPFGVPVGGVGVGVAAIRTVFTPLTATAAAWPCPCPWPLGGEAGEGLPGPCPLSVVEPRRLDGLLEDMCCDCCGCCGCCCCCCLDEEIGLGPVHSSPSPAVTTSSPSFPSPAPVTNTTAKSSRPSTVPPLRPSPSSSASTSAGGLGPRLD